MDINNKHFTPLALHVQGKYRGNVLQLERFFFSICIDWYWNGKQHFLFGYLCFSFRDSTMGDSKQARGNSTSENILQFKILIVINDHV